MKTSNERKKMVRQISNFGYSVTEAEKKRVSSTKIANEDTKIRIEIRQYILGKLAEGKSKEDLLKRMGFVFGRQKYKPYVQYFEGWVDEAIRKRDEQIRKIEKKSQSQRQDER